MIKLAADENFNNDIVRALLRRNPSDDPTVLEWAAREQRVLLTHDVSTITRYAYERVRQELAMPGVFEIPRGLGIKDTIEDLLLLAEYSRTGEWEGQVQYLPL